MEMEFKSFNEQINEIKARSAPRAGNVSYDEALTTVVEEIKKKSRVQLGKSDDEIIRQKNQDYLKEIEARYKTIIRDILAYKAIKVPEFPDNEKLVDRLTSECVGYDILSEAMNCPTVTDIYIINKDTIFLEDSGVNKKYPYSFRDDAHLNKFIERITTEAGKELNEGAGKISDFELYGNRYCATSASATPLSPSMTIRKHPVDHIKFQDLLDKKVLNDEMADLIKMTIKGERNIIVAGITGSGKTTTLRASLDEVVTTLNKRMIVCEDTQELFPKNEHTLSLVSTKLGEVEVQINLEDLVLAALRLKPKYIVVGEVRGEEALAAVEAMETGHSTLFTMHSDTPINCINRLATKYLKASPSLNIDVVERILGAALDYIFIQDDVPGIGRKIVDMSEVSYDYENRRINIKPIYKFDFKSESFQRVGDVSDEKANLMLRRGVKLKEIEPWLMGSKKGEI